MKKLILIAALIAAGSTISFAQCDKSLLFTSSKTDHIDASGTVTRTEEETAKVELTKTDVTITVRGDHVMKGAIKDEVCNWKTPFKDGKTTFKAVLSDSNGDDSNVTITIEGKDGKITLWFEKEGLTDDRIRVAADKFEEVK